MLYVLVSDGKALRAATEATLEAELGEGWLRLALAAGWQSRSDWDARGWEWVEEAAQQLTDATGVLYLSVDNGPGCYPRYDVVEAPKVGDRVSRSFNGDSYPAGEVVSVSRSPQCRLVVSRDVTGHEYRFHRRRSTGAWIERGTWSMVEGHVSKWNPSV